MKYDLPPELASGSGAGLPSLAAYLQALKADLPDWLRRALQTTLERLDRARAATLLPAERAGLIDLMALLQARQGAWLQALVDTLAQSLDGDVRAAVDAPAPASSGDELSFTLLDEDTVDEDIALSRLVQAAESGAEQALRDLAARCSSIRGLASVSVDANPMRPAVVAGAVRRAVGGFGLPAAQRLLLLRELGAAVGGQLVQQYQQQCERLVDWGVAPTKFTLRLTLPDGRPGLGAGLGAGVAGGPAGASQGAGASAGPTSQAPAPAELARDALRRLGVDAQVVSGSATPAPDVMAQLLGVLLSRVPLTDEARDLIRRLDPPARRIARQEPAVWQSPEHPLWLLLDRLVAAGTVHDTRQPVPGADPSAPDTQGHTLGDALERAVQQLESSHAPDSAQCLAALSSVDFAITGLLDEQASRVAPQAQALQQHMARSEMEDRLREQVVQQVRDSGAPPALRRFLVGPWAAALAHSAQQHGSDSPQMRGQAELVDHLIAACLRPAGQRLSTSAFTRCITHARLGLADAGLPATRVDAEVADLEQVLRQPWGERVDNSADGPAAPLAAPEATPAAVPVAAAVAAAVAKDAALAIPSPVALTSGSPHPRFDATAPLGLHEALPTVPIDMFPANGEPVDGAAASPVAAWLDGLQPGQVCRLYLLDRWMNAQLVWCSDNRSMFVFNSRHGGRTHSLTRRSLDKLRAAGLATTIERGQFVAQALRELAGQGPSRGTTGGQPPV